MEARNTENKQYGGDEQKEPAEAHKKAQQIKLSHQNKTHWEKN